MLASIRHLIGAERVRRLTPPPTRGPGPFVIGRSPTCDLYLEDPTVSVHHADLYGTEYGWKLVDVGSRNGTRVNGWRTRATFLRDGDQVQIGDASFVFEDL